jgi:sodium/proline symporter
MVWSFVLLLIAITAAGAFSIVRKKKTTEDYLVASRNVNPWLSALSAVGTNNSGFMFIGMIGYTYRLGIESIWMMFGWIAGDFIGWLFVHSRVRRASEEVQVKTLPALIGTRRISEDRWLVIAGGVITLVFLAVYAAGQLKAGSTALHTLFDWDESAGILIGALIVIVYSYAGGIRADIWTDAAQSAVMLLSMGAILIAGWLQIGGPYELMATLERSDPAIVTLFPQDLRFGFLPYVLGMLAGGFGAIGQPHLMTRFMAIESVGAVRKARFYYFLWFVPFFAISVSVGLYCRALIPDLTALPIAQGVEQPTELALPLMTMRLLPGIFVGISLAGLFAATVSTADSQIIVCSGALTHDIHPRWQHSYVASKIGTFSVTAFAVLIALYAHEGVFDLVLIAWSAMGASLGPLLVLRLFHRPLSPQTGLAMMAAAVATVVWWHSSDLDDDLFKMLPGMVAAMLVYGVARGAAGLRAAVGRD